MKYAAMLSQMSVVDVVLEEFPGCEPGALVERPRLVGIDVDLLASFNRCADDAQRRAITACGKRTSVAVRQDSAFMRQQLCAKGAQAAQIGDVLVVQTLGQRN